MKLGLVLLLYLLYNTLCVVFTPDIFYNERCIIMSKVENQQNDYRAERKKRLAKNAKKSGKKNVDSVKVVTWVVRVASVILVLCITAFALYQFGVPQKILPAVTVGERTYSVAEYSYYYSSVFQNYAQQSSSLQSSYGYMTFDYTKDPSLQTTTDEDGEKITYDELFRKSVIATLETTNYYLAKCEEEGIKLSEDHQKEIDELITSLETNATAQALSLSRYISIIYGKGLNEKIFRDLLTEQYLVAQYVEDVTADLNTSFTAEELEAAYNEDPAAFQAVDIRLFGFEVADDEKKSDETTTAKPEETTATDDETTSATEETTAAEETTASDETTTEVAEPENKEPTKTEKLANEMLDRVRNEATFIELAREYCAEEDKETFEDDTATLALNIKKSIVENQIGKDLAEWLYSADRKTGDKTVYSTDDYVYVIYIIRTAYREEQPLVDARHILVSFENVAKTLKETEGNKIDTEKKSDVEVKTETAEDGTVITNEGTGYTIELIKEAYKTATGIYDKYMSGDKTEEAFAKLAEENSADTGSIGENTLGGGLYEGIEKGKMVAPFENWIYDEARKTGDVEIIMTNYGWHIMYFVKQHEEPAWKAAARETLGTEAYEKYEEGITAETEGTATAKTFLDFAASEACKNAASLYA